MLFKTMEKAKAWRDAHRPDASVLWDANAKMYKISYLPF